MASIPVDLDEQILVGVACPAGVPECMDDVLLPMLAGTVSSSDVAEQVADDTASMADAGILLPADSAGTLSPPDPAGILFPAVPAGIPFLAGPVGPVGTLYPSDPAGILFPAVPAGIPLCPVGHVGPVGTLSPSDPAGILFPAVPAGIPFTAGPVGPVGTLSPSDPAGILFPAVPAGIPFPAGPVGTLSPSDPAGILFPAVSAGILFPAGPVGTLSLSDQAAVLFPAIPTGMMFPADPDIDGMSSPTDSAGMLFPDRSALMNPDVALLPPDPTVFDIGSVVDMAVVEEVLPAVPDVFGSRAVVAMVGVDAVQTGEGIPMDCDDRCDVQDLRNYFETVDGMPVYYGGDFNDEDHRDLAYADWVDWYNFNAPEGCCVDLPDKGEVRLPNAMGTMMMMMGEVVQPARGRQELLGTSVPVMDIGITVPVGGIPVAGNGATV